MRVLYTHDTQKTLSEKGIKREPLKLLSFVMPNTLMSF